MNIAVRAACEAAAWAFAGVFLALGLFFFSISGSVGDVAAMTAALGLVGAITAFVAVASLVGGRFPGKSPVVGARRGAAIGVLVVVVVPTASAFFSAGSGGLLYSIYGQVFWSVVVAGGPFAVAGAVLGRKMDRTLFGSRGDCLPGPVSSNVSGLETRMPTLSYRCSEDNWLSFELLVDGEPLGALVGSRDTAFPYWIVEDGLPRWPPHGPSTAPDVRIICVCSCGEYGCGHAQCHVAQDGTDVVFHGFDYDVSPEGARKEFRFGAGNYAAVCKEIAARARKQRQLDATRR